MRHPGEVIYHLIRNETSLFMFLNPTDINGFFYFSHLSCAVTLIRVAACTIPFIPSKFKHHESSIISQFYISKFKHFTFSFFLLDSCYVYLFYKLSSAALSIFHNFII